MPAFETTGPILLIMAVVAVLSLIPKVSRPAEWLVTLVHEVGHGIIALPFGGHPSRILLRSDGSGQADVQYQGGLMMKPVRILSLLAGYSAPFYLAFVLFYSLWTHQNFIAYIALAVIGILALFLIRNFFAVIVVILYLALLGASYVFVFHHHLFLVAAIALLLARGVKDVIGVARLVFDKRLEAVTDFHLLKQETWLPAGFWYGFFLLVHGAGVSALVWAVLTHVPYTGIVL